MAAISTRTQRHTCAHAYQNDAMVAMATETMHNIGGRCGPLCQHPGCWESGKKKIAGQKHTRYSSYLHDLLHRLPPSSEQDISKEGEIVFLCALFRNKHFTYVASKETGSNFVEHFFNEEDDAQLPTHS